MKNTILCKTLTCRFVKYIFLHDSGLAAQGDHPRRNGRRCNRLDVLLSGPVGSLAGILAPRTETAARCPESRWVGHGALASARGGCGGPGGYPDSEWPRTGLICLWKPS